jgi:predicted Zn-dependent protease
LGSKDSNSKLVFSLTGDIGAQFEYALEKIAHMVDSISIKIKNLETNRHVMSYTYDVITMKWVLSEKF